MTLIASPFQFQSNNFFHIFVIVLLVKCEKNWTLFNLFYFNNEKSVCLNGPFFVGFVDNFGSSDDVMIK